jgi:2-oxo-4-hydroxy-4-carboxy--5-ureidoimidazoline (OHCU) decarboxylase
MTLNQAIKITKRLLNNTTDEEEKTALAQLINIARKQQRVDRSNLSVKWGRSQLK